MRTTVIFDVVNVPVLSELWSNRAAKTAVKGQNKTEGISSVVSERSAGAGTRGGGCRRERESVFERERVRESERECVF
eukprot:959186-Rhodomonas_salina.1